MRAYRHAAAFALPTVLLLLGLLVGLGTAFLAFALGGTRSATSGVDQLRADSAAAAGLEEAGMRLTTAIRHDAFLVLSSTGAHPFFFIGDADPAVTGTMGMLCTPLFSGGKPTIQARNIQPSPNWNDTPSVAVLMPFGFDRSADVRWIPLVEPDTGCTNARYAFWIEDIAAYLDMERVGNNRGPGGAHLREDGTGAHEIAAFTIFEPASPEDSTTQDNILIEHRPRLPTVGSLSQIFENPGLASRFSGGIREDNEPQIIPFGFHYADEGDPKSDLNALALARDAGGIVSQIRRNLPCFEKRRGGMESAEAYLGTIAASVIDYADKDGNPTIWNGCRGIDSYPFVNEMFDRYAWVSGSGPTIHIEVTTYIELWNPSDKRSTGVMQFLNHNRHAIAINGLQRFTDGGPWTVAVDLPPNAFKVIAFPKAIYTFDAGRPIASPLWFAETTDSSYELRWNGSIVDLPRGGLQRTAGTLRAGQANRKWKGHSSPALDYGNGQFGDPRASAIITTWIFANDYDQNSSWGGRNVRRGITNPDYAAVDLTRWPDGGHNSAPGTAPGNDAKNPDTLQIPPPEPERAPLHISNAGHMNQISELGNIFDPAQWVNLGSQDLPASRAGGGFTLRVGRPEFSAFDADGMRARQLLDIFCVAPSRLTAGLVNINTAGRETLRALMAGVMHRRDRALKPSLLAPNRGAQEQGGAFADAVIASRPFLSTSDMAGISNIWGPFFGNTNQWSQDTGPSDWNDAAAEECFGRIHDLTAVHSRNFRVSIMAEALGRDGARRAMSRRVFQLFIRPVRENGCLISNIVEISYAARY